MEACASAHHWGRWLTGLGIAVKPPPARYVRTYVKRNRTDAADALCREMNNFENLDPAPLSVSGIVLARHWCASIYARNNAFMRD